jgi:hypothetical protein
MVVVMDVEFAAEPIVTLLRFQACRDIHHRQMVRPRQPVEILRVRGLRALPLRDRVDPPRQQTRVLVQHFERVRQPLVLLRGRHRLRAVELDLLHERRFRVPLALLREFAKVRPRDPPVLLYRPPDVRRQRGPCAVLDSP